MNLKLTLTVALILLFFGQHKAQDELLNELENSIEKTTENINFHFKSQYLINAQTTEMLPKGEADFRITHRFGNILGESGGGHTLWGFDQATNIRFSLDYGLRDNILVGIGRSKTSENIDGYLKYKILQQNTKNTPVSVCLYTSAVFTPQKNSNAIYDNWIQRFSYTSQIIVSKKIGNRLTLGFLPTAIYRNLVVNSADQSYNDNNLIYSFGGLLRYKVNPRFSLIAEYFYTLGDLRRQDAMYNYHNPLGLGIEIETGGHVFHLNVTNSAGIIYNDFIPYTFDSWLNKGFKLGFTISRNFVVAKSK
jgi:hypothetical protein